MATVRIGPTGWVLREPHDEAEEWLLDDPLSLACHENPHGEALAYYAEHVRPGMFCVDVGANIGVHTIAMAKAGARVLAFEPQWPLAAQCIANVLLHGFIEQVRVVDVGLADRRGFFRPKPPIEGLHLGEHADGRIDYDRSRHVGSLYLSACDRTDPDAVACMPPGEALASLRSAFPLSGWGPIGLIKIDAQGMDGVILRDLAREILPQERPRVLFEWEHWIPREREQFLVLVELLTRCGYALRQLDNERDWVAEPKA